MAILNLPYVYPKWKLQWDIDQEGLAYDYFHCPQEGRTGRNRGFAFVNFLTPEAAAAFQRSFDNRELSYLGAAAKVVSVVPSELQGLEENSALHPDGLVLIPQSHLQRHYQQYQQRQQWQQQLRHQQAPATGSSNSLGPQPVEPAAVVHDFASSSSSAATVLPHSPSPFGVFYRFSF